MGIYLWISCGQPSLSGWNDVMKVYLWLVSDQPKPLGWGDALILSVSNEVAQDVLA
jgi:hypothetical protein